jgi:fatty acid desaturase
MYPAVDRENLLPLQPSLSPITLFQIFTLNLFSKPDRVFSKGGFFSTVYLTGLSSFGRIGFTQIPCQEWLQALHDDQPLQHRKSIIWSRILLLFHSCILMVSIISGHWWLFLVITLSSFMANWASYFVGLTQHCGLQNNVPDFRKNTRTITLNPILSFLYWHMNWHIEHHMFAGVPCYNLKKLHEEIKLDMPEPRTLIGAWKEMVEIWRVQKFDQDYQLDTPIPDSRMKDKRVNADPLASSIGDLAPNF